MMKRLLILIFVLVSIQVLAQVPGELGDYTIRVINYDPSTFYIVYLYQNNDLIYTDTIQPGTNILYTVDSFKHYKMKLLCGKNNVLCFPEGVSKLHIDEQGRWSIKLNYLLNLYSSNPTTRA